MTSRMAAVGMALAIVAGCSDSEPTRYRVSGTASYEGKPIPYGEVLFTPDGSKQNSGPQGIATIRDGQFDTAVGGKGIAGGPTVIKVTALTKQGGQLLGEYPLTMDLPRADSTQNFDGSGDKGAKPPPRKDI